MTAGRIGRAHGVDGSFYLEHPSRALEVGATVTAGGTARRVERSAGTAARPLVRLSGVADRTDADALRGEDVLIDDEETPLDADEWLADDLVGCRVEGLGEVTKVVSAPSCDLLVVGESEILVPFVRDAVRSVDSASRRIEVDLEFLALAPPRPPREPRR